MGLGGEVGVGFGWGICFGIIRFDIGVDFGFLRRGGGEEGGGGDSWGF